MSTSLRWGIIGTGMIAGIFADAAPHARLAILSAVASRKPERAQAFAAAHRVPRHFGSYAALLADPDIDAVYIATPHPHHHADTLQALRAGKHVLVEKPMAVTVAQAQEMADVATQTGCVLLEAFMYRVHPQSQRLEALLLANTIGSVRVIRSCFTFGLGDAPNVRLDPGLFGGALWDVGCYCVNASRWIAGEEPVHISGEAWIERKTGVDAHTAGILRFPSGIIGHFDVGIRSSGSQGLEILGDAGRIWLPTPWKPDATRTTFRVETAQGSREEVIEHGGDIYALEADHLAMVVAGAPSPISAESGVANTSVLVALHQQLHA
jgi:xylose dehydrogenase (NAD/NADP)